MKERLTVNLELLREEGIEIREDLDPGFFELPPKDGVPAGPVELDLRAQRFESELVLTGYVGAPFKLTCTGCLEEFVQTIELDPAGIAHEITQGGEVDVTEELREEILINFPAHPRCYEGDEERECKIDPRYLAVDKSGEDAVETPPTPPSDSRWSALDGLSDELGGTND